MVKAKWNGVERREKMGEMHGRRNPDDRHCSDHSMIWEFHDKDKDEHRESTCGAISKLDAEVASVRRSIVGRWTFGLIMTVLLAIFAWAGNMFIGRIEKVSDNVETGIASIHRRITETQTTMASNAKERIDTDIAQTKELGKINVTMENINVRLLQIEKGHDIKPNKATN